MAAGGVAAAGLVAAIVIGRFAGRAPRVELPPRQDARAAPTAAPQARALENVARIQGTPPAAAVAATFGCVSVNASPFAAVYVDGKHVADTPRACVRIRTGRHRIQFQSERQWSPEHVIVVQEAHSPDEPLRVSFDFRGREFLAR
jgi:hypothetical protein